jgi:hypothetical protein
MKDFGCVSRATGPNAASRSFGIHWLQDAVELGNKMSNFLKHSAQAKALVCCQEKKHVICGVLRKNISTSKVVSLELSIHPDRLLCLQTVTHCMIDRFLAALQMHIAHGTRNSAQEA